MYYLDISQTAMNHQQLLSIIPGHQNTLLVLKLASNNITYLGSYTFSSLHHLEELVLHGNTLHKLDTNTFSGLSRITSLDLSSLHIAFVADCAFCGMPNIMTINLSDNNIEVIRIGMFLQTFNQLSSLDIRRNTIRKVAPKLFSLFVNNFEVRYTSQELCCFTSRREAICDNVTDDSIYCVELLPTESHQYLLIFVMLFIILTNILATIFHGKSFRHKPYFLFIQVLGFCGISFGIYLAILINGNLFYKKQFVFEKNLWTHSYTCVICRAIVLGSYFMSTYTSTLIAIHYLFVTKYPLHRHNSGLHSVVLRIVIGVCVAAMFTSVLEVSGDVTTSTSNTCIPHYSAKHKSTMAILVVYMVVILLLQCVKLFCHVSTLKCMVVSAQNVGIKRHKTFRKLVVRSFIIVSSGFFGCILISILYMTHAQEKALIILLLGFGVDPITNPFLYTFSTNSFLSVFYTMLKKRKKKA